MKSTLFAFTLLLSYSISSASNLPQVVFGDLTHNGPYDRSEILLQEEINVMTHGSDFKIIEFDIIISPESPDAARFHVIGNRLPPKVQGALNQILEGHKVVIKSVSAHPTDDPSDILELKPIILEVKQFKNKGPHKSISKPTPPKANSPVYAQFGDIAPDNLPIEKERLLMQDNIYAIGTSEINYTISEFKMIIAFKDAPPVFATSSSNHLTDSMKKLLTEVKSEDKIIIEGITAKSPINGEVVSTFLSPVVYSVE